MRRLGILLLFVLYVVQAFSKEIHFSTCYKGYYFFIPVIKNCISYDEIDGKGKFTTNVKTIGILKAFKDIKYTGIALSKNNFSERFFFIQRERDFSVEYWYEFRENLIFSNKTVKKGGNIKRFSKVIDNKDRYLDPFTASVLLFKNFKTRKEGFMKIFFNGKKYKIPYRLSGKEIIKAGKRQYRCYVVLVEPDLKGEGLLKIKGQWKLWIDEKTGFPVKVKAVFDKGIIYLKKID